MNFFNIYNLNKNENSYNWRLWFYRFKFSYFFKKKHNIYSLDNLFRKGSSYNQARLKNNNIKNYKIDITNYKNFKKLPRFDLIIDCCAEPSVNASLVEIDRVIKTNLIGTLNILKKCSSDKSKLIFLSSSRVYSLNYLKKLKLKKKIVKSKFQFPPQQMKQNLFMDSLSIHQST